MLSSCHQAMAITTIKTTSSDQTEKGAMNAPHEVALDALRLLRRARLRQIGHGHDRHPPTTKPSQPTKRRKTCREATPAAVTTTETTTTAACRAQQPPQA